VAHQHRLAGRELPSAGAMGSAVSGRACERVEGVCVGCYQCACECPRWSECTGGGQGECASVCGMRC
jgi:hypothetical protein